MREQVIVVVGIVLAACGRGSGSGSGSATGSGKPRPQLSSQAPVVADARVLLGESGAPPPVLVIVAADGSLGVFDTPTAAGAAEPWARLNQPPRRAPVAVDRDDLGDLIREVTATNASIEARAKQAATQDPPDLSSLNDPPPPPEEPEDDGADESGGTGTAVALEEGKMGKKDSDRAEGQYKMKPSSDDPQLVRAIDAARDAGAFGISYSFGDGVGPANSDLPDRAAVVFGAAPDSRSRPARALVIAAPTAKAAPVVYLLADIGGARLGVAHQGRLRALRIGFGLLRDDSMSRPEDTTWVEVRVSAGELAVEAVPSPAVTIPAGAGGGVDAAALGKAYAAALASLGDEARRDVDVLVGPDTDVQRLVDVVAALDAAGALIVSLGPLPPADELAKRGKDIPRVFAGEPQAVGELEKKVIRRRMKDELPKIKACYERALAINPALTGTVKTQFFVSPNGVVASCNAAGVDTEMAACVAAIIKAIEFPKPGGGGGVQVNFPFTFRN